VVLSSLIDDMNRVRGWYRPVVVATRAPLVILMKSLDVIVRLLQPLPPEHRYVMSSGSIAITHQVVFCLYCDSLGLIRQSS
jgi:hypothetical protein